MSTDIEPENDREAALTPIARFATLISDRMALFAVSDVGLFTHSEEDGFKRVQKQNPIVSDDVYVSLSAATPLSDMLSHGPTRSALSPEGQHRVFAKDAEKIGAKIMRIIQAVRSGRKLEPSKGGLDVIVDDRQEKFYINVRPLLEDPEIANKALDIYERRRFMGNAIKGAASLATGSDAARRFTKKQMTPADKIVAPFEAIGSAALALGMAGEPLVKALRNNPALQGDKQGRWERFIDNLQTQLTQTPQR